MTIRVEEAPVKEDFILLPGESKATPISDPRIGNPKKILVIGGGPAGLISLHELLNPVNRPDGSTLDGYDIQLYERRAQIGGVWYVEPENEIAKGWHHGAQGFYANNYKDTAAHGVQNGHANPSKRYPTGGMKMKQRNKPSAANVYEDTSTEVNEDRHMNGNSVENSSYVSQDFCYLSKPQHAPRWPSPAYEGLVGNALIPLVEFSAEPFPMPKDGLFPSLAETHNYLLDLAEPLQPFIKVCQEVVEVVPKFHPRSERVSWAVTKVDWSGGQGHTSTEEWDAVIAAVGAFDHPYWPKIPGLAELRQQGSSLIMHARTYSGPRPFINQHNRFVVVGNSNSGNDIAAQLAPLNSDGPIYRCIRHPSYFAYLPDSRIRDVAPIKSIAVANDCKTLNLELEDGTKLDGITKIIFASGYEYHFEWLRVPTAPPKVDGSFPPNIALQSASKYGAVPNLHNTTFLATAPTLAFVGLSASYSPLPLAEVQARLVARALNGVVQLPMTQDGLLRHYNQRAVELNLHEDEPSKWRELHMVRGLPERQISSILLEQLEESEKGCSKGLFRWDERREGVAKGLRAAKESELRRLGNANIVTGGSARSDAGKGSVCIALQYGLTIGQKFAPVFDCEHRARGRSLWL